MGDFSPQDFSAVVQTVAGEGANQPPEAQRAIASTILNRHAIQGGAIADIASDPKVYNGAKSKNASAASLGSPLYSTIAENIAPVFTEGPTTKATHFVNPTLQSDLGRKQPAWAQGEGEKIGDHVFYDRSDDLRGGPSADDIEAHIQGAASPIPVDRTTLKPLKGYISNPDAPPEEGAAIPIGGPSADDIEKAAGFATEKPLTEAEKAAAADATRNEAELTSIIPNPTVAVPAFQGLTQGFGDEIKGKLFGAGTGIKNAILDAMGKPIPYSMAQADAAETHAARHALSGISKAHPIVSTASEVTGGVLPWLAGGELLGGAKAVAEAPTALGRAVQLAGRIGKGTIKGGTAGAAGGALSGFGNAEGDASERGGGAVQGAETGAVLGGVLGAGAPVVAPIVGRVASALGGEAAAGAGAARQGVSNALSGLTGKPVETSAADYFAAKSPMAQKLKGLTTPADVAESVEPTAAETRLAQDRVSQMMASKGMHTDDLRAVPEDIPHTTAEAIGSQTVNHLASLARRSGVTPDAAASQIAQRAQAFGTSILDDFGSATGIHPEEASGNIDALVGRLKGEADPLFAAVRSHPGPVWSPELAQISQRPIVAKAIDAAANDLRNAGKDPLAAGFKLNPDSGLYELNGNTLEKTTENQPTAETWEQVRQFLGHQVDRNPLTGKVIPDTQSRGNFNINAAKRDLTTLLAGDAKGEGALIPGYRNALDASGEYLSAKGAFDRGASSLLTDKVTPRMFEKTFADLSPAEQQAWKAGVANKLYDQSQTQTGLRVAMLKSPAFQAKIRTVMGDQAEGFLDRLTQRVRLQATGNRIMPGGGSQTTPLLQASQETSPTDALGNLVKEVAHAKASPGTFLLKQVLDKNISDKARNIAETPGYRNAYGRLLLQHPRATADELRAAGREAARTVPRSRLPVGATAGYVGGQTGRPSQ